MYLSLRILSALEFHRCNLTINGSSILFFYTTDKGSATLCDDDHFNLHHILVYSVAPAGLLFIICIALIISICTITLKKDTHTINFVQSITKELKELDGNLTALLSQQQACAYTDHSQARDTSGQRNASIADTAGNGLTVANPPETLSGGSDQGGGTDDQTDGGIEPVPSLTQQQSAARLSSNIKSRSAYKDNPVYQLVKKSMKGAKFPERKYRRLKEELRSTCEKCKKDQ